MNLDTSKMVTLGDFLDVLDGLIEMHSERYLVAVGFGVWNYSPPLPDGTPAIVNVSNRGQMLLGEMRSEFGAFLNIPSGEIDRSSPARLWFDDDNGQEFKLDLQCFIDEHAGLDFQIDT